MRKALLLAVTVATAVLAKDSRCLQKTDDTPNLIHEDDCRKYYLCDENQNALEQKCPEGLEFNPLILKCDLPRGFCTPFTNRPVENVMSCNGLPDGAYYPDLVDDCRSFYNCHNGISKISACMDGTKFDLKTRKCIDETKVQCGSGLKKRAQICNKMGTRFIAHKEDGCKSYTECHDGVSFHRYCEGSQIFNEQINKCDWPQNVKCGISVHLRNKMISYSDYNAEICQDKLSGSVIGPNRNSKCASYFICKNGKVVEKYCGDKLVFNWKIGVCDLPENVDGCDVDNQGKSFVDCTNKHNLRIQHPDDCSSYVSCHLGRAYLHKCAKGQRFNNSMNVCMDDEEGKCFKSSTTSEEILNLLAERPFKRDSKDRTNSYPNYANGCRSYFDCKSTVCKERFCRKNYAYNAQHLRCEPDEMVFCDTIDNTEGAANILVQNGTSSVRGRATPSYIDCCVNQGTWYEDKEDCRSFYVCVLGEAIRQQCHSGQTFDVVRKICRVGAPCGGSTPSPSTTTTTTTTTKSTTTSTSTSTASPPPITGPTTECKEGDVKPYPYDLNMYYKCIGGIWREVSCPAGQIFNPTTKACQAAGNGNNCTNGQTKPYPWDPTKYYQCIGGIWREVTCPVGQQFNPVASKCEVAGTSTCQDGAKVPNYFNSTTYYQCHNNYWILLSCPPNQTFNNVTLNCEGGPTTGVTTPTVPVTPSVTTPSTNSTPPITPSPPPNSTVSPVTPTNPSPVCIHGEIYADDFYKNKFYVCYNGMLQSQICPQGMTFNPTKKYCEISNSACGDIPHGGFSPASQSDKYYVCYDGQLVLQLCPAGQLFNPALGYCSISGPPTLPPPPPPPPPPSTDCGPIKQGQFVADLNNENKFFVCIFGTLWSQSCPNDMVFNNQTLSCVSKPTTSPPGGCGPYSQGAMISTCDPLHPDYYLICVFGVFIIKKCPDGLNFDPTTQNCSISSGGGTGAGACGTYENGATWANNQSDTSYYQCINGSTISLTCPSGLVFSATGGFCINPCGSYKATTSPYYVGSPNSASSYYTCSGSPPQIFGGVANCPSGTEFYQALGSLSPANACMNPSTIAGFCPAGSSFTNIQISPNSECPPALASASPYYVTCNNGTAIVQRCPLNFIVYEGACMFSTDCTTTTPGSAVNTCICI